MKMNKKILTAFFLVSVSLLSLCLFGGCGRTFGIKDKIADKRMKQIIAAITSKDEDSLKAMFSSKAISEADDIDEKINHLFEFFQGKVKTNERKGLSFYDSVESRKVMKKEYYSWYRVNTEKYNYFFIIIEFPVDILYPDNVGIYTLMVIKSDEESIEFSWEEIEKAGVYMLEE